VARWKEAHEMCGHLAGLLSQKRRIHIHGDYDVDGITSTAILAAALRRAGGQVTYTIPNRFRDGYGLSLAAVAHAAQQGAQVLVALDCGTNDAAARTEAVRLGMEMLVLDHHLPGDGADAPGLMINPHLPGCPPSMRHLTSAGIAFEVALGLGDFTEKRENAVSLARLACLGIAQDVAPLVEDNRIIVKLGMDNLPTTKNPFLKGLLASSGLAGESLCSQHLFYRLGPRLNAPGRLEDASFLVDLLLEGREDQVRPGLEKLEQLNRDRQELQERMTKEAESQADPDAPCIIAAGEDWHLGVVGLVAGKLASRFRRPAFVFSLQKMQARGSGRSVAGISIVEALQPAAGMFASFGGHAGACGLTIARGQWEEAKAGILDAFRRFPPGREEAGLEAEEEIALTDLNEETVQFLSAMEPYGPGNPRPAFLARDVEILGEPMPIGHYGFRLMLRQAGKILPAAYFGGDRLPAFPRPLSPLFGVSRYRGAAQLDLEGYLS